MAVEASQLTWGLAIKLLDANLPFRSPVKEYSAPRAYRGFANGPELRISAQDDNLYVVLPFAVPALNLAPLLRENATAYRYEISTVEQLLACIATLVSTVNTQVPPDEEVKPTKTEVKMTVRHALNSILYGPPGTGKTFKTAQLAVSICDGHVPSDRAELMARYAELRKEERISFVTFHQSYGYEDFVEGLRPEAEDGQISYQVRPGIFRTACDAARRKTLVKPGVNGVPLRDRRIFKMSLGASGKAEGRQVFQACIENEVVLLGWGEDIDYSDLNSQEEMLAHAKSEGGEFPESDARFVNVFKNDVRVGDLIIASHGNTAFKAIAEVVGEYEFTETPLVLHFHQKRRVRWLGIYEGTRPVDEIFDRNFSMSSLYRLDPAGLKFDALERLLQPEASTPNGPCVLIIDEINRANISKVFGELITLLEADKREGETNALHVKLPYSGADFCVPRNLYVVGTMNTSDRSIALLDTALRRRFEFEELQPDPAALPAEAVDGIDLRAMLRAINERIEYLYDRDHTIGHAYLLGVGSLAELDQVFRRKIIPLLQEYFYEDWSKVRAVLNDLEGGFIERQDEMPRGLAAFVDAYEAKPRYGMRQSPFSAAAFLKIYE